MTSSSGKIHPDDTKYELGLEKIREVHGDSGVQTVESLKDIAPDLGRFIAEFAYVDVISRPGLDVQTRELITVAALVALGNARPQLKIHLHGALQVGCSRKELVELMLQ